MHYTGNIIRPPHEARNVLLQVTVGCSHNSCTFCSLYHDVKFRMSPMEEIEADLREVRSVYPEAPRVFLLNADAFVMSFEKLRAIALKINHYLPNCKIISMYASVSNVKNKTVEQLRELRSLGINKLTMGIESGYDELLKEVNKGYSSADTVEQCGKLTAAGMDYSIIYLGALAGRGRCEKNAYESAKVFNQINPTHIGATSLTLLPGSQLHDDAVNGRFQEASELERAKEMYVLLDNLSIDTFFAVNHVSNAVVVKGRIPEDQKKMTAMLQSYIENFDEHIHRSWRDNLRSI